MIRSGGRLGDDQRGWEGEVINPNTRKIALSMSLETTTSAAIKRKIKSTGVVENTSRHPYTY